MNFNLFSLITTYLFAFALATPVVEEQAIAKRTFSGSDILDHVNHLITFVNQLNSYASSHKASQSAASSDFLDLASSTKDAAATFKTACGSFDNKVYPVSGLVSGILQLVALCVDLCVSCGLWILSVKLELIFDCVSLCATLCLYILEGIQSIINGGNWAFAGAAVPCSSAIALLKSFCSLHSISY